MVVIAVSTIVFILFPSLIILHFILLAFIERKTFIKIINTCFIILYMTLSIGYGKFMFDTFTEVYFSFHENERASFSPDGEEIVFTGSCAGEEKNVYIMNKDGSKLRRLTRTRSYGPIFSHDGQKIMFTYYGGSDIGAQIYIMDINGKNQHRLTNNNGEFSYGDPSFSPDDSQITFAKYIDIDKKNAYIRSFKCHGICIMNSDGTNERTIYFAKENEALSAPSFLPNGKEIIFFADGKILTANITQPESNIRIIANIDDGADPIIFSDDGNKVVFRKVRTYSFVYSDGKKYSRGFKNDLFIMDLDGRNRIKLTKEGTINNYPFFHPDGKKINFFSLTKPKDYAMWQVNIDGSNLHRVKLKKLRNFLPSSHFAELN